MMGKIEQDFLLYFCCLEPSIGLPSLHSSLAIKRLFLYVFMGRIRSVFAVRIVDSQSGFFVGHIFHCALAIHLSDDKEVPGVLIKKQCLDGSDMFLNLRSMILLTIFNAAESGGGE